MGAADGKQHYYPACLIGRFNANGLKPQKSIRENKVFYFDSNCLGKVLRAEAQNLGVINKRKHIYNTSYDKKDLFRLDDLLKQGEDHIVIFSEIYSCIEKNLLNNNFDNGDIEVSKEKFITAIAPTIATILTRSIHIKLYFPEIYRRIRDENVSLTLEDLEPNNEFYNIAIERMKNSFFSVSTEIILSANWFFAIPPKGEYFITNDVGFSYQEENDIYIIFIPVSKNLAILIQKSENLNDSLYYSNKGNKSIPVPILTLTDKEFKEAFFRMINRKAKQHYFSEQSQAFKAMKFYKKIIKKKKNKNNEENGIYRVINHSIIYENDYNKEKWGAFEIFQAIQNEYENACGGIAFNRKKRREQTKLIKQIFKRISIAFNLNFNKNNKIKCFHDPYAKGIEKIHYLGTDHYKSTQ